MLKKLISIVSIVLCFVLVFGACGKNGNANGSTNGGNTTADGKYIVKGTDGNGNWIKVDKVAAPNYKSGNMTLEEFEKAYRPYTDYRIYEIRTTKSEVKPAAGGTAYYVSNKGDAKNDGLTPQTPVPSYVTVMGKLKSGDVVYFERGSEWRGHIDLSKPGITLAAYGEGMAPVFKLYKESASGKDKWLATDVPNVYKFYQKSASDIGVIVFDETDFSYKAFYKKDLPEGSKTKKNVSSYKDLKYDLQMYHDYTKKDIYVYCEKGNPGEVYKDIEFVPSGNVFKVSADNITIDGLCIKYAGFGISGSTAAASHTITGLTVRNCEFGWIGGYSNAATDARLGNGIEIWGGAVDFLVENCYFYQIYDAGVTFQFSSADKEADVENVIFRNNVFDYNNYSIEYFMTIPGNKLMKDFVIEGNLCWYAGEGMCSQRPDRNGPNHIKSWGHSNKCANQIQVKNNLFALGFRQLCETLDKTGLGAKYTGNVYVQTEGKRVAVNTPLTDYFKMDTNVKQNIEQYLGDKNAVIISIAK